MPRHLRQAEEQYQIYALIDPRDNITRYIGISRDAMVRYYQHITAPCSRKTLRWIEELGKLGLHPVLQLLETIRRQADMSSEAFRLAVYEREAYWINEYLRQGTPLLNTFGVIRKYPPRGNIRPQRTESRLVLTDNQIPNDFHKERENFVSLPPTNVTNMTLAELIEEALMTNTEVARQAGLNVSTISRMVHGHLISRSSVSKVLDVVSQKLGQKIDINEVRGLNLADRASKSHLS